jgi:hypothetical protein
MVTSLADRCANQAKRRAANATAAATTIRSASSLPPTLPAHPSVPPHPPQNSHRYGNDNGKEHLLTPTVERTATIFDLLAAKSGLPTMIPPTAAATFATANTTTIVATATTAAATANNDNVDESHDIVPDHFVCPITKLIMTNPVSDAFGHSYKSHNRTLALQAQHQPCDWDAASKQDSYSQPCALEHYSGLLQLRRHRRPHCFQ